MPDEDRPNRGKAAGRPSRRAKGRTTTTSAGRATSKTTGQPTDKSVGQAKAAGGGRPARRGRNIDPEPAITIKKYANRRLYNTYSSSYVTLEDLAGLVREGQEFSVLDAKSGEDITRSVLTQIIFEEESRGGHMLPVRFLRQIIALYGDKIQSFVPSYLEMTMENFVKNRETMRNSISQALANTPGFKLFEDTARQNRAMFEQGMQLFGAGQPAAPSPWRKRQAGAPSGPADKQMAGWQMAGGQMVEGEAVSGDQPEGPEISAERIAALEAEIEGLKRALDRARGPSRTRRTRKSPAQDS